jgi:general secretion pathway protein M
VRLDIQLDREQSLALAALALVMTICVTGASLALASLGEAAADNAERREMLTKLEAARRHGNGPKGRPLESLAPDAAFVAAPTAGLASAQLQAYVTRLVSSQHANLVSSGAELAPRADAEDSVRLQATFEMALPGLQALLHELETGTPYVFVEKLSIQPPSGLRHRPAEQPVLLVTLNLRALWRRTAT